MDIALITTTIYVPEVLRAYRHAGPDVLIIIAGDMKSPHLAIEELVKGIDALYLLPADQGRWACSEAIGWNSIRRRNIAILEALARGADVIVTVDDDNLPLGDYFTDLEAAMTRKTWLTKIAWDSPLDGPILDYGAMWDPPYIQRGSPLNAARDYRVEICGPAELGLLQGVILGEPDRAARERLAGPVPKLTHIPELLREGVIVDVDVCVPINTQNTAMVAELARWFPCLPHVGRADDIWGSFIAQRAARELGYDVAIGPPVVWQERNEHDITVDYEQELYGDRHAARFVNFLEDNGLTGLDDCELLPQATRSFWRAWREDVEGL